MVALPDDVEAPDPYADSSSPQDAAAPSLATARDHIDMEMGQRAAFAAAVMPWAPVDADELVRRALAKRTNKPGFCLQEQRLLADIPALWPNASAAARAAVGVRNERRGPGGAYAYWIGGASGDGHIAAFLPNGLIRSTDAGGTGLWGTRTLEWFDTHWPSLTYVGWADNTNNRRVPGVIGDWFDMVEKAELAEMLDTRFDARFSALNLRIDGLVERQQKILLGLNAIDTELDGVATKDQLQRTRQQIRDLKAIALEKS